MGPGLGGLAGVPGELLAPVPNAPLSVNATVTYGQGQQNTVELARDANGRTYIKTTLPARPHRDGAQDNSGDNSANASPPNHADLAGQTVIYIADPVAQKAYVIFPDRQEVMERKLPPPRNHVDGATPGPEGMQGPEDVKPQGQGPGNATWKSLGTQQIAGIEAQGTDFSRDVPARGNRPAGTADRQIWYAPTLHLLMQATVTGPRGREVSYAVQSVDQNPPDASLFTVPSGYTVKQMRGHGFRGPRGPHNQGQPGQPGQQGQPPEAPPTA